MLRNKILKETFWSFLSKGTTLILFLAFNIYLARSLNISDYGKWSFFLSLITIIITVSYFGINNSSKKFIGQFNGTSSLGNVLMSSLKLRVVFSFIFSIVILIVGAFLSTFSGKQELGLLLLWSAPVIFFSGLVEFLKSVFIGLHRIKYNFFITTLEFALKLLFVVLFFYISPSLLSIIFSFDFALLFATILGLYFFYRFYPKVILQDKSFAKEIMNYSYPFIFISVGFIALTELDTIMLGLLSTTEQIGIYAVAKQIVSKLPQISFALAIGTMPIFAKINSSNAGEFKKKFYRIFFINGGVFVLFSLLLIFFAPFLVPFLFGDEYKSAILPMQLLSIHMFLYANSVILSEFLDYAGKAKKRAINVFVIIILNIALGFLLIPSYGAIGAALAVIFSYLPYVILNLFEVIKFFKEMRSQ
jgi:O-antigen/teichoic acid export membrane protein